MYIAHMNDYYSEPCYKIKDKDGELVVAVSSDPSGSGCIRIADSDSGNEQFIYIPPAAAKLVARAIIDVADNIHFAENSNFA